MKFKLKKGKGTMWAVIFLVILSMGFGGGIFFYLFQKNKNPYDNLPPIIKQMIVLNEDVKKTTIDIYTLSEKLTGISMVTSRITDIGSAIKLIESLRQLVEKNKSAIDRLIGFIEEHADFVYRKNLAWVFAIKKFYMDPHLEENHKSRMNYLASFQTMLRYTHKNFQNIMELQSKQHMKNYDVYYLRWRRAADSHNRVNKKQIAFLTSFLEAHPEVSSFLPGPHQTGPFKLWDKSSF